MMRDLISLQLCLMLCEFVAGLLSVVNSSFLFDRLKV